MASEAVYPASLFLLNPELFFGTIWPPFVRKVLFDARSGYP
jgi:hypothetical protein